jgi:multidrug efflux pump subunit AcrA (membrane-fusion protein)
MHGEKTALAALAKVAAMRASLREEKADLDKAQAQLEPIYEDWMQAIGTGCRLTKANRRKCDKVVKMRKTMQKRTAEIETRLAKLNRDGAEIKKHCTSSDDEIQAEIRAYRQRAAEVQSEAAATEFMASEQRKNLRRVLS